MSNKFQKIILSVYFDVLISCVAVEKSQQAKIHLLDIYPAISEHSTSPLQAIISHTGCKKNNYAA